MMREHREVLFMLGGFLFGLLLTAWLVHGMKLGSEPLGRACYTLVHPLSQHTDTVDVCFHAQP